MKRNTIKTAIEIAKRFIETAKKLEEENNKKLKEMKETYKYFKNESLAYTKESAQLKRVSMDLPRILADLRLVKVVPMAPSVEAYPAPIEKDLSAARQKFRLAQPFLFYPAKTWAHKNHMGLFESAVHPSREARPHPSPCLLRWEDTFFL